MAVDHRLQMVLDYLDHLTDAQNAAISAGQRAKAQVIQDQIEAANDLRQQVLFVIMREDDDALAGLKVTIDNENRKLQNFKHQIQTFVDDVAMAARLVADIVKIAGFVGAL